MTYMSLFSIPALSKLQASVLSVPHSSTLHLSVRSVSPRARDEALTIKEARTAAGGVGQGGAKSAIIFKRAIVAGVETASGAISAQDVEETVPSLPAQPPLANQRSPKRPFKPALKLDFWRDNLPKIYSPSRCRSVLSQLTEGVRVGRLPADSAITSHNWPSAMKFRDQVNKIIEEDLLAGRLFGPFIKSPFNHFIVSPLGAFPKRASTKVRLIHDLSFPLEGSVNALIDPEQLRLTYPSVDDAAAICRSMGLAPPYLAKLDLENAFKHIFVHPDDWHLLGFTWPDAAGRNRFYFSKVLNFGLRSSPFLFDVFASALAEFMSVGGGHGSHRPLCR